MSSPDVLWRSILKGHCALKEYTSTRAAWGSPCLYTQLLFRKKRLEDRLPLTWNVVSYNFVCPLKHIKKSRKSKNTYFGKLRFCKKNPCFYFFLNVPQQYLQLRRRHRIDQKIHSKVTDFRIFTYHFCMDS
uniref:(northern house mosquito) hypothetical protein n=1 Tax=Culex pipiens TaxID=7175 RepID=A0A8D8B0D1_CULPI